jgi:hypothetical protein
VHLINSFCLCLSSFTCWAGMTPVPTSLLWSIPACTGQHLVHQRCSTAFGTNFHSFSCDLHDQEQRPWLCTHDGTKPTASQPNQTSWPLLTSLWRQQLHLHPSI